MRLQNQERELCAVADRMGWEVVNVYMDHGISGAKSREERPAFDALAKDAARRRFGMVVAWSVDGRGRSLQDLVWASSPDLHAYGIDLFLHQQGLDTATTTPSGGMMFQMMGVFAEFERAMIQERVRAGLERARAQGKRLGRMTHRRPERSCDQGLSAGGQGRHHEARSGAWSRRGDGPADQPRTGAQPQSGAAAVPAGCPPTEIDPKRLWRLTGGPGGLRLLRSPPASRAVSFRAIISTPCRRLI